MGRFDWIKRRGRGIHMTIRDVDCAGFDAEAMAVEFKRLHATFFSFFAGGYVTTYPTALSMQRPSPFLGGRDLVADIVAAAHRHDLMAVPMIDLGQLPRHAFDAHPEWAARDGAGKPVAVTDGIYRACPMGGYIREYSREIVAEICARYDVDGMKFGGGSYGFGATICTCQSCRDAYHRDTGADLPASVDWSSPAYRSYVRWRFDRTAQTVSLLVDMTHGIRPGLPVVGNAVCFGDPGWAIGATLDMDRLAAIQDAAQVEVQTRFWQPVDGGTPSWQYLRWPAETASFMTTISSRPVWAVASYFLAWPWRRVAAPPVEQKAYLALAAAHGACPMVNLSGGPPAVHEDTRGFAAMADLFGFMDRHTALYEGDGSAAEIALVFDQNTLVFYGNDHAASRYVNELRGFEQALHEAHIPFDIISTTALTSDTAKRYRTLILPNLAWIDDAAVAVLRECVAAGTGLVATFETGLFDDKGRPRPDFAFSREFGASFTGKILATTGEAADGPQQAYMRPKTRHAILKNCGMAGLLPVAGPFCSVVANSNAMVPLVRAQPFRVFPEGLSYPEGDDPGEPMAVLNASGNFRSAYFPFKIGSLFIGTRIPDLGALIADTVLWVTQTPPPVTVSGPSSLHTSLRRNGNRLLVHCVNLTGGERFFTQIVPLHDVTVSIRVPQGKKISRGWQASSGMVLPTTTDGEYCRVTVPKLEDYDIIVFEAGDGP